MNPPPRHFPLPPKSNLRLEVFGNRCFPVVGDRLLDGRWLRVADRFVTRVKAAPIAPTLVAALPVEPSEVSQTNQLAHSPRSQRHVSSGSRDNDITPRLKKCVVVVASCFVQYRKRCGMRMARLPDFFIGARRFTLEQVPFQKKKPVSVGVRHGLATFDCLSPGDYRPPVVRSAFECAQIRRFRRERL